MICLVDGSCLKLNLDSLFSICPTWQHDQIQLVQPKFLLLFLTISCGSVFLTISCGSVDNTVNCSAKEQKFLVIFIEHSLVDQNKQRSLQIHTSLNHLDKECSEACVTKGTVA